MYKSKTSFLKKMCAGAFLLALACPSLWAVDVTVTVAGSAGCSNGAQVMAVAMGEYGPDHTKTKVVTANSSGVASFTGGNTLDATAHYQFMAINTNCAPSMRDQAMDYNNYPRPASDYANGKTITLNDDTSGGTIVIALTVDNAGTFIMGGCRNNNSFEDVAFGMASLAGTTGNITFFNIPPAPANTYDCGIFSPADDKGGGRFIDSAVAAGQTVTLTGSDGIDLTQHFAPPPMVEDEAMRDRHRVGAGTADLTVVVTSSATGNAVDHAQLKLKRSATGGPDYFADTDPRGIATFYGLMNDTTYYMDIFMPGFEGVTNRVFYSADWIAQPKSTSVVLNVMTGDGKIYGSVTMEGAAVPHVWVSCRPDWRSYPGLDQATAQGSDPNAMQQPWPGGSWGGTNASTGSFVISNLPAGNYECDANSPFTNQPTMVNFGPDGQMGGTDDLRITVSTNSILSVYAAAPGAALISSNTALSVSLAVDTSTVRNGTISGKVYFPDAADLTSSPITIMAHEEHGGRPGQRPKVGFASVNGVGAEQTYTMQVETGVKYFLEIRGTNYGPVHMGPSNFADLTEATTIAGLDFHMAKAGSVNVTLFGPDGYRFVPKTQPQPGDDPNNFMNEFCSGNVHAEGMNVDAWGWGELSQEGDVTIAGLPAGTYMLGFASHGKGCQVAETYIDGVVVNVDTTTSVTMNLKKGIKVEVTTGDLPPDIGVMGPGEPPEMVGRIVGFHKGTPLTFDNLNLMHGRGGSDAPINLQQMKFYSPEDPHSQEQTAWMGHGGWDSAPKVPPGDYTLHVFAEGFPNMGPPPGEEMPSTPIDPGFMYLTALGKKNALIDKAHETTASTVFFSSVVAVNIDTSYGDATITGTMTGDKMMTKRDFDKMGGDFDKFLAYMPMCAVYDSDNNLAGFSMGIPASFGENEMGIEDAVKNRDSDDFISRIGQVTLQYGIKLLQAGTYTNVCTTPNYPPVVQKVVLRSGQTTTSNIDFDVQAGTGGSISGVVTTTGSVALKGASVVIKNRTSSRQATTAADGSYSFEGLSDSMYRMSVTYQDYAKATDKAAILSSSEETVDFTMTYAPGDIQGTVVASRFPSRKLAAGVKIMAFDGTQAGTRVTVEPPVWETKTGTDGTYKLPNPVPGNVIRIFAVADGKIVVGTSTVATAGSVTAPEITLLSVPPIPTVQFKPGASAGTVDLHVAIPKLLTENPSIKCVAGDTYSEASATDFTSLVVSAPDKTYMAEGITLPDSAGNNVCRVTTKDGSKTQNVDTVINPTDRGKSNNIIDRAAVTGGSASVDPENTAAGSLDFIIGSVEFAQGTVPTSQLEKIDADNASLPTSTQTVVSDAYVVTLSSSAQISTGREVSLTLALNRNDVLDPNGVRIAQVVNGELVEIPDKPFYDPITGTVSLDIKSIDDAPAAAGALRGARSPSASLFKGMAPFANGRYAYDPMTAAVQTGKFVVISKALAGAAYSGTSLNAYNFPNPFNLKSKTLTLASGGSTSSLTTTGTILRYDLPSTGTGHVVIRIYNLSGELVRTLDEGTQTGGRTYYSTWDGKNKSGDKVASGVYFAIFDVPGQDAKDHVIKMAVIK